MNTTQFLLIVGTALNVISIFGFSGAIGPTPEESIFGEIWHFGTGENVIHVLLGTGMLLGASLLSHSAKRISVMAIGILGILFGLYSAIGTVPKGVVIYNVGLENPTDTLLHLAIGIFALWASLRKPSIIAPL